MADAPVSEIRDLNGYAEMRTRLLERFEDVRDELVRGGWTADCPACPMDAPTRFFLDRSLKIETCPAGHTASVIAAIVIATTQTREPGEDDDTDAPVTLSMGVADFFATCDSEILWLLEPYLFAGGFTLVQGAPKSGKTWFVAWCAARVALDGHNVLFVEEEGAREVLRDRLKPFLSDPASVNDMLHVAFRKRFRLDSQKSVEALIDEVRRTGARLLVLDPFIGLHSKREKESDEMTVVVAAIQEVIAATGCAVLLVHHTRKGDSWSKTSTTDASSEDARGSGALVGAVDTILAVKALPNVKRIEGEVRFYLENPDTRVGAPFARKLLSIRLSDGAIAEHAEVSPEEATAELLERVLPMLPAAPQSVTREVLQRSLRVRRGKLLEAIYLGLQLNKIIESGRKGVSRGPN